ncbi:hypothetical protein Q31b_35360 [Novipirellula aureliae]|uniref:DNA mimic protein DMP19 C-terminal domain-containing protein n=1 Tax=Novipirellula aureliae TaxID=2527966 RepID=A0A5C6DXS1_9BACT|nr:DUF4375 domain-containing protein [Novipirellula aureliae]TWU40191.1 hypothetical protein Q31b_35360 [Novipirellula aureliae]
MAKFLIVVIILFAFGLAIRHFARTRAGQTEKSPGFREFVKNPELWNDMIAGHEETDATAELANSWSVEEIRSNVERYVFAPESPRELWELGRVLRSLSPRTNDALMSILADESKQGQLAKLQQGDLLEEAPVMRICELFDGNMPVQAIPLLRPFLSHESDEIRKNCVLAIAETGLPESLPAVERAIEDKDEYVRSYALMGMKRAIEANELSPTVSTGALPFLESLVRRDQNVEDAARILTQLDSARAASFLLSDEILNDNRRYLHEILRVINQFDLEIGRDRVKSLIQTYAGREMKYPNNYALGESLALLGVHKMAEDAALLEEFSNHPDDKVSEGAARGLIASHGLQNFEERIWEKEKSGGWESLNKDQQMYLAVFWLDAEVNNGGHSQYFFNSAGSNWAVAQDGLKAMGFTERLAIFNGVLSLFGEEKPFRNRDERHEQLASVYANNEEAFDKFDSKYYAAIESVEVLLRRFVIQNAESFVQ